MTSSSPKTIAIFGATGAQGAPVVKEALSKGHIVRAVARDVAKIAAVHPDAIAVAADLSDEVAVAKALHGVDAAFLHFPMPSGPDDSQNWAAAFFAAAHQVNLPLLVYVTGGPSGDRFPSSAIVDGTTQGMKAVLGSGIPSIVLQSAVYLENLQPEIFLPDLRSEGKLDYPPIPKTMKMKMKMKMKMQWTSHLDQATLAVAAMSRPDLAGQSFEIGTPQALSGAELAELMGKWVGRDVAFDPMTPAEFGTRVGDALGSPGAAFALGDLYGAIAKLDGDDMAVDTGALEATFGVKLTSVADHINSWS
ncbi:NmrA family NAD(P)-binding protein [uncultured Tateyamaria sp.]|uniref:SDR family oxidoreductase n=1 Tax=uncultured Tateyamaria sp. TaxID=455651 RepID=UPI002606F53A|nr:NmrA family NAD(P)-binding protein [uncultured Tateyamaria sp.]